MVTWSTITEPACVMLMPFVPSVVPAPLMSMLRRTTVELVRPLTMTPWTPEERMLPSVPMQSIVIDFVIVTAPNPPGSRQLMRPGVAGFGLAPANVLHGAVRLHGLASSPTPDTHVRVAWACASVVMPRVKTERIRTLFIWGLLLNLLNGNLDLKTLVENCAPPKRGFVFGLGARYSSFFGAPGPWP